jgi:hypothetical protein
MRPSKGSGKDSLILNWLSTLGKHFKTELSEDEINIFLKALQNSTSYQLDKAFDTCLNNCLFMPKLAEVHKRMPEQKWPPENPGKFVLNGPPTLDLIRPFVTPLPDSASDQEIMEAWAEGTRRRYKAIGVDPEKWKGLPGRPKRPRFTIFKKREPGDEQVVR